MLQLIVIACLLLAPVVLWLSFRAPSSQLVLLVAGSFGASLLAVCLWFAVPLEIFLAALPFAVLIPVAGASLVATFGPAAPSDDAATGGSAGP